MLYLIHRWPGWDAVPFLTDETPRILGWVDASIWAGLIANLLYVAHDGPRFRGLGGLVTSGIGAIAVLRILQVFPFDLEPPWVALVKVALIVGFVGSVIGVLVNLTQVVLGHPARRR
jgi:hypothetical protein